MSVSTEKKFIIGCSVLVDVPTASQVSVYFVDGISLRVPLWNEQRISLPRFGLDGLLLSTDDDRISDPVSQALLFR